MRTASLRENSGTAEQVSRRKSQISKLKFQELTGQMGWVSMLAVAGWFDGYCIKENIRR